MSNQKDQIKRRVREWWAANPMTYAHDHGTTEFTAPDGSRHRVEIGSREFFEAADQIFYRWNKPLHTQDGYFGNIFDYARYNQKRVLEVGCGMGCMAMNWALHKADITAVDLNPVAVKQTRQRFNLYGLNGIIQEADAEQLPFTNNHFDYAYSWGVLHHTPNAEKAINEIFRVLRPGAEAGVMLYHRASVLYRYFVEYVEGYIHLENEFLSPLQLGSRYSDGALAEGNPLTWPVTRREVHECLFSKFNDVKIKVLGTDLDDILDHWFPKLGLLLPKPMRKSLARRWGWSLWITAVKPV